MQWHIFMCPKHERRAVATIPEQRTISERRTSLLATLFVVQPERIKVPVQAHIGTNDAFFPYKVALLASIFSGVHERMLALSVDASTTACVCNCCADFVTCSEMDQLKD